jgi:hypothetical protein
MRKSDNQKTLEGFVKNHLYDTYYQLCHQEGAEPVSLDTLLRVVTMCSVNIKRMVDDHGIDKRPYIGMAIDNVFTCLVQVNPANPPDKQVEVGIVRTEALPLLVEPKRRTF